jgi:cystathionine beta-lyase
MTFEFDQEIDKHGTHCVKWEFIDQDGERVYTDHAHPKYGPDRVIPMWVADMDFRSPPAVVEAIVKRAQHGVYGYSSPTDSYYEAVINWMARRVGRRVEREWIVITPGVVPGINMMIQTFVKPGEKVLIQGPVYHPFYHAIENNEAQIVSNSLIYEDGVYRMDFDDLAQKAADPEVKMAILCSPHNPIGRVWTAGELRRFGEICLANDVLVVSDELHGDLIQPGHTFTSFATLGQQFAHHSIVCTGASKSFNLAGLKTSNIIISNQELREAFTKTIERNALMSSNPFGIVAIEVAYTHGEAWLDEVNHYVGENYRFMKAYLEEHLPQLALSPLEGTYLVWVNFNALGLEPETRKKWMMEQAKLCLDEGELFGPEGRGFERFNIACPRSLLEEALDRLTLAVAALETSGAERATAG